MNQQQQDVFGTYENMQYAAPTNGRSPPSSTRGYGQHSLHRQGSRHFDNYDPNSYHAAFLNPQRNDTGRFEAAPIGFPYDTNSWAHVGNGMQQAHNMVGSQMGMPMTMGSATLGASSRRTPNNRRTPLPTVCVRSRTSLSLTNCVQQPWIAEPHSHQVFDRNGSSQAYNPMTNSESTERADDEELIPTAIVIKNIPFAVKKEQLTDIMSKNSLPLPYAFNYHFDSGVFRGLAFANFSTPEETQHVIEIMNHMEISGRKLRVEYKKMLPQRERERIEREKRERRGQLEEQHRPITQGNTMLHNQSSLSSLTPNLTPNPTNSPSPVSTRMGTEEMASGRCYGQSLGQNDANVNLELDMNDPNTLNYYTQLMVFLADVNKDAIVFPTHTTPHDRRIIHTIAHQKSLDHTSTGQGEHRQVIVSKVKTNPPVATMSLNSMYSNDYSRRGLNRAATTDFSNVNRGDNREYHNLERQGSFLDIPNSPNGFGGRQNLREAKSFADLRSHSGSPSLLNSANFPSMPGSRYDLTGLPNGRSATPTLTPTSSNNTTVGHDDLVNTMNSLSVGYPNERPATNRTNGRLNMERDNYSAVTGAIGSHRQTNGTYGDRNGGSLVERQPRLPGWKETPFSRGRQDGIAGQSNSEFERNRSTHVWDDNKS